MTQELLFWLIFGMCKKHTPIELCETKIRICYMNQVQIINQKDPQRVLAECYLRSFNGEM